MSEEIWIPLVILLLMGTVGWIFIGFWVMLVVLGFYVPWLVYLYFDDIVGVLKR